ncbi:hypothetical protein ACFQZE_11310 [Paenibacillus sp. GCM10027627]
MVNSIPSQNETTEAPYEAACKCALYGAFLRAHNGRGWPLRPAAREEKGIEATTPGDLEQGQGIFKKTGRLCAEQRF